MLRSLTYRALALRVRTFGEANREAWFLTGEEGLVRATVFGGPKSRLRSQVAPFHEGTLWIYRDPVRDSRKVSDFDVRSWRPGIRELWERVMAAGAVAETILASRGGGGNWQEALNLAGAVLDALDGASAGVCPRLAVYFLWHWAQFLGVKPDLSACASCGREPEREETLRYSAGNDALFCEKCAREPSFGNPGAGGYAPRGAGASDGLTVGPGARLWLKGIESLPPAALERVGADAPSFAQAKAFSQAVMAAALGKRLPTWDGV